MDTGFSVAAVTDDHSFVALSNVQLGRPESKNGPRQAEIKVPEGCVLSRGTRRVSVLPFSASRGHLNPLTPGPFLLHLQSQQQQLSFHPAISLAPTLPHLRTLVLTLGPPG